MAYKTQAISQRTVFFAFIFSFIALIIDGADLMLLSYCLPSLTEDFHLTKTEAGSLGSITLAAMAIGGIYGGYCCDRFGRVHTIVWSMGLFSIGTAMLGFTHNFWQFAIIRFFGSLGLGSIYISCTTLMSEYVSSRHRSTVLGTLQSGWSIGYIVATLLAGWILPSYGWRYMFYITLIPVVFSFLMYMIVPEPPAWRNLHEKAFKGKEQKTQESTLTKIFSDPFARKILFLWIAATTFLQFGYYGVNTWIPSYLEGELNMEFKSMTGYMVGTYTVMIFGKVLAGLAGDFFGRRNVYVFGSLGTAAFIVAIVLWHTPENILGLMLVFGFFYGIPMGILGTYMSESFHTQIRGTAVGLAYNAGRIGAALAPVTIGLLATKSSIGLGFIIMGVAYVLTAIIPLMGIKEHIADPEKLEGTK